MHKIRSRKRLRKTDKFIKTLHFCRIVLYIFVIPLLIYDYSKWQEKNNDNMNSWSAYGGFAITMLYHPFLKGYTLLWISCVHGLRDSLTKFDPLRLSWKRSLSV